ncbi:potassium-transporting ATPase subunit KdpC [Chitinophaga sancti]|uniref:Potassium-transporting ATPase KdpC subunit n=1 Tax=Chitinophaga sancti TaxID=1004 RepID=A0A1K1SZH5_9BACT|nr:potassium-transporting ATPase subunit KdpC [Chitinophaga sancti]WQD63639.1 potassium-transporting ATPase subunit KdpC [Chitinophaga sancti]WQG90736.1 potassium-transporting ATPase subunit KdpC [Chitinophaga sancti]SFW89652.1 K+-transporting ATPase ATPase C chain [Chitinophaga sancti]
MKKYLLPSIKLTLILILLLGVAYPLLIAGVAHFARGAGKGRVVLSNGKVVGYENVGQKFTSDKYFQGRPSAVDYNAAGSGGSNKAVSNPDYLKTVQERIDTFLAHNPGTVAADIPSELVTASGSGLDPDISPAAAEIQVIRVAAVRHLDVGGLRKLIADHTDKSWLGPDKINVLKLNIALDALK